MTGLNHALTGIAIAITIRRPEFAIPLAFLSHFVLDSVPHSGVDQSNKRLFTTYLVFEAFAMTTVTIIAMVLFPEIWFLVGLCAFVAFLPDAFWPFYHDGALKNTPIFKQYYIFHKGIQWSESTAGWIVEIIYFWIVGIYILQQATL